MPAGWSKRGVVAINSCPAEKMTREMLSILNESVPLSARSCFLEVPNRQIDSAFIPTCANAMHLSSGRVMLKVLTVAQVLLTYCVEQVSPATGSHHVCSQISAKQVILKPEIVA